MGRGSGGRRRRRGVKRAASPITLVEAKLHLLESGVGLTCSHGKPIHHCPLCSKAGEQYEVDRQIEELAGGTEPEEWLAQASEFEKAVVRLKRTHGARAPETREAKRAYRQCIDIARALNAARKTRGEGERPRTPKPVLETPGLAPTPSIIQSAR